MMKLLRARQGVYKRVKYYQGVYLLLTLTLPIASYFLAERADGTRASVALTAIVVGLLEAAFFDRWQKNQLRIAAKLQEEFDCDVLGLPWNSFLVGSKVSPEDTNAYARVKLSKVREEALRSWYPERSDALPPFLAALVCQRANLWYDGKLRKAFLVGILLVGTAVVVGALLVSTATGVSLASVVLAAVPAVPFLTWAALEHARQRSTIETLDRLKNEIERLWGQLRCDGKLEQANLKSRELQDAIFNHRASSPLIFDWIYFLLRKRLEEDMGVGVDSWVGELVHIKEEVKS
jgi:SMODS-associating 4TM effector domain